MTLTEELTRINSIFIDTAPIIYYIEAHPAFGPLAKEVVTAFQSGNLAAYSSVMTLTDVFAKTDRERRRKARPEIRRLPQTR